MFDFNRTVKLIKGAVFDPDTTWKEYLPEAGDWKKTATLLTGPLVVGSVVLAFIVDRIIPNRLSFIPEPGFGSLFTGLLAMAIIAGLVAFIVSFLAGMFKGKNSFAHGLAATTLAFVPGYAGQVLAKLPWIGWLLGLALFVYSLVLLYRIIPTYLEVPDTSRLGHYILSVVGVIVASLLLGMLIGGASLSRDANDFQRSLGDAGEQRGSSTGMFGAMERAGRVVEEAENDQYDPPSDGKVSDRQVGTLLSVIQKTRDLRERQARELKELSDKAKKNDIAAMQDVFSGLGGVMGLSTAEMEVVKTAGGNWAEHQWVKEQLRIAMIQQDINEAVKHNFELYKKYESELEQYPGF
ncbi:MAG: YIP1 family protein [Gammaproteobacteria bacterium]|nr:YIP1 family protein [Gammaproteobacteria bacterium]